MDSVWYSTDCESSREPGIEENFFAKHTNSTSNYHTLLDWDTFFEVLKYIIVVFVQRHLLWIAPYHTNVIYSIRFKIAAREDPLLNDRYYQWPGLNYNLPSTWTYITNKHKIVTNSYRCILLRLGRLSKWTYCRMKELLVHHKGTPTSNFLVKLPPTFQHQLII